MLAINNLTNNSNLKFVSKESVSGYTNKKTIPCNVPLLVGAESKVNLKMSFSSSNYGDTFVKTQPITEENSKKSFMSRLFGDIDYGSFVESSNYYNIY